jgi:PAS domain S-box-containing protein
MTQLADHQNHAISRPDGLAAIVMKSKVPMVIADSAIPDTPLIIANDAFVRMTGYERDEIIGRNCRFLQPSDDLTVIRQRMRDFQSDERVLQGDFILPNVRKDGTRFLNLLYMSKLTYPGRTPLFLGSQFDITRQTAARLRDFSETLKKDVSEMNKVLRFEGWSIVPPFIKLDATLARIAHYELS